jgi:hypothetical protein
MSDDAESSVGAETAAAELVATTPRDRRAVVHGSGFASAPGSCWRAAMTKRATALLEELERTKRRASRAVLRGRAARSRPLRARV